MRKIFSDQSPRGSNIYEQEYTVREYDIFCDILDKMRGSLESVVIEDFFRSDTDLIEKAKDRLFDIFRFNMVRSFKNISRENVLISPHIVESETYGNIKLVLVNFGNKFLLSLTDIYLFDKDDQPNVKIRFTFYPESGKKIPPMIWMNYFGDYDIDLEFMD